MLKRLSRPEAEEKHKIVMRGWLSHSTGYITPKHRVSCKVGISPLVIADSHCDAEAHRRSCKWIAAVSVNAKTQRSFKELYKDTLDDDTVAHRCVQFVTARAHLAETESIRHPI